MNTTPKAPATIAAFDPDAYVPGDPIPVPQAVEANTESTWAMFEDVPRLKEPEFQDTVPFPMLDEKAMGLLPKKPT